MGAGVGWRCTSESIRCDCCDKSRESRRDEVCGESGGLEATDDALVSSIDELRSCSKLSSMVDRESNRASSRDSVFLSRPLHPTV